jgi:hypothetical protein
MSSFEILRTVEPNSSSQIVGRTRPDPASSASTTQSSVNTDFSRVLAKVQLTRATTSSKPPANRWQSLGFLTTSTAPRITWPWTHSVLGQTLEAAATGLQTAVDAIAPYLPQLGTPSVAGLQPSSAFLSTNQPMALADYPHPPGDNGRGIHWIPTTSQTPEVIDRFVDEAKAMGMRWVVFLNEGTNIGANDYLVKRLHQAGIEPVMRIYTPGLVPIEGNIKKMVDHYKDLGVRYFQLYNEPNLIVETGGQYPDVEHYLDLWLPAAQQIIDAGGLPGFGALSPQGELDDRDFLRQALNSLKNRGQLQVLDRTWLASHNYTGPRPLDDPNGFLRFQQYDEIVRTALGRSLPIIGTEGGTHITENVSEEQQVKMVMGAYDYMAHREPYNFAYTYWIIANGHDPAWDKHALIRSDGPTALAQALKNMAAGGTT